MARTKHRDPYYLRHFHRLADRVLARDASLFLPEEQERIEGIRELGADARRLLLRIAGRREGWLRLSRLEYVELGDRGAALAELAASEWIDSWPLDPADPAPPEEAVLATLTRGEVQHLLGSEGNRHEDAASARLRLLDRLSRARADEDQHRGQLGLWPGVPPLEGLAALDGWIRLRNRRLFQRLELLFFGNRHQTLAQLVVAQKGQQRFEPVTPDARGPCADRDEAEALLDEGERFDALQQARFELQVSLKGWRSHSPLPAGLAAATRGWLATAWRFAAPATAPTRLETDPLDGAAMRRRLRLRTLLAGASLLERLGRPAAAVRWLRLALAGGLAGRRRNEAWQRLVLDSRKAKGRPAMEAAAREALAEDPGAVAALDLARRLGQPLALRPPPERRLSARIHPGHRGGRTLLQGAQGAALTVEDWVLEHESARGWHGLHAENRLLRALVGLSAWELVFAPVPGAFLHRFQTAPRDWGRADFLARRADLWRTLRAQLDADMHREAVRRRLERKVARLNPLVDWRLFVDIDAGRESPSPVLQPWRFGLELLLERIPGPVLAQAIERMLRQPSALGHGLPDLLLWKIAADGSVDEWKLAEVKGPGDRLFDAQRIWLDWLLERGLPAEVVVIEV